MSAATCEALMLNAVRCRLGAGSSATVAAITHANAHDAVMRARGRVAIMMLLLIFLWRRSVSN